MMDLLYSNHLNKDIVYGLTVLVIDVGKDSHIKGLINNVRCLDCGATDYDIITPQWHHYDVMNNLDPPFYMYNITVE